MTSFTGFPIEGLKFLNALKENNNREWFNQHKSDYVKYVQGPAQDFVVVLGAKLKAISAGLQFDPSLSGSGSVMRIYRDIRFSKDKTPYKTYQGIRFWEGISRKEMFSGIYIGIDENGAGMYLGRYEFPKEILLAFRKAVDDEDTGKELEAVISKVRSYASVGGDQYKGVPRGYPQEHPRSELLKYKNLYASVQGIAPEIVTSSDFLGVCVEHFETMLPLHKWLVALGDSMMD